MKANEFQIGDWAQWNFDVEPKHRQIFSIITEEDSDGNKEYYVDLGDGEIYKDLIPISLTPEILEKNGWKTGMYSTFDLEDNKWLEYYHHEARLRKYWQGVDEWQNCAEVKEIVFQCKYIRYVHEFQHALRLCGLIDLADNFKI